MIARGSLRPLQLRIFRFLTKGTCVGEIQPGRHSGKRPGTGALRPGGGVVGEPGRDEERGRDVEHDDGEAKARDESAASGEIKGNRRGTLKTESARLDAAAAY